MAGKRQAAGGAVVDLLAAFERTLDKALAVARENPEALPGYGVTQGNPRNLAPRVAETGDWVGKQIGNAQNAAQRWKDRVRTPRKDPVAEAKKASQKWKNKMQEAIQGDRFAKGLAQVDEAAMIETIEATDPTVFSGGIERRRGKITSKVEKLRPKVLALANTLDAMPTNTDAEREAKMIAARRGMLKIGSEMKS